MLRWLWIFKHDFHNVLVVLAGLYYPVRRPWRMRFFALNRHEVVFQAVAGVLAVRTVSSGVWLRTGSEPALEPL